MKFKTILAGLVLAFCSSALAVINVIPASANPTFAPGQTLNSVASPVSTYTPAQAASFVANTTGAILGTHYLLEIISSGTTTYRITFAAGFTTIGTLDTGGVSGVTWAIDYIFDGTNFVEAGRYRQGSPASTLTYAAGTTTLKYSEGARNIAYTPTAAVTLAIDVVGRSGATMVLQLIGDSTGRAITPGTNLKITTATISTSADTNSTFLSLVSDGTTWLETGRTVATAASADDNA